MSDTIDEWRNDFKGYVNALNISRDDYNGIMAYIDELPSAQPEHTCVGCKHYGIWENEVEYGYPSPCTGCKRRANDNYEQ